MALPRGAVGPFPGRLRGWNWGSLWCGVCRLIWMCTAATWQLAWCTMRGGSAAPTTGSIRCITGHMDPSKGLRPARPSPLKMIRLVGLWKCRDESYRSMCWDLKFFFLYIFNAQNKICWKWIHHPYTRLMFPISFLRTTNFSGCSSRVHGIWLILSPPQH